MSDKYLNETGLAEVAVHVNSRLKTVTTMPVSADNGAVRLYVGVDTQNYSKGHIYQYQTNEWVDITGSGGEAVDTEAREVAAGAMALANQAIDDVAAIPDGVIPKGTIAFANLPSLSSVEVGWMYNISDDFTTTSDFINSGISEKAGSNVYCANTGTSQSPVKKWDVFAVSSNVVVDQSYSSSSTNAQSGTAVAQAINTIPCDTQPTKNSQKFMKSGDIYDSIAMINGDSFIRNTSINNQVNCLYKFNNKLYAGMLNDNGLWISTDGSTFTQNSSFPTNYGVYCLCEFNNKLYVGTQYGLYISSDGNLFELNSSLPNNIIIFDVCVFNNKLYAGTNNGLYVSTDGSTFTLSYDDEIYITPLCVFNNKLYAGTDNGLYVSTDGQNFTNIDIGTEGSIIDSFCVFNNKLYVGLMQEGIYVSSNGTSFTQNSSFPDNEQDVYLYATEDTIYAGVIHGLYKSTDGDVFTKNTAYPDTSFTKTFCEFNDTLYVGGTYLYVREPVNSPFVNQILEMSGGDVDQTYDSTSTNAQSGVAVAEAINSLDVSSVGGSGKYISAISETDGKISATETTMDTTPTTNSTNACTSGGVKDYVDTQITTAITQVLNTSF